MGHKDGVGGNCGACRRERVHTAPLGHFLGGEKPQKRLKSKDLDPVLREAYMPGGMGPYDDNRERE